MDKENINNIYIQVSENLRLITVKRKSAIWFQKTIWLLVFLFFTLFILYIYSQYFPNSQNFIFDWLRNFKFNLVNYNFILISFIGFSIIFSVITYSFSYLFKTYKTKEKQTIQFIINSLFPEFYFTQNLHLKTIKIRESKLFPWLKIGTPIVTYGYLDIKKENINLHIYDIGIIENNIGNKIIEILFKIPFINLLVMMYQYVLKNIFTSKSADNTYFTFRGIYGYASFNKKLKGTTVVFTNNITSKTNRILSLKFKEEEKIILEDSRFNKLFSVYGTNQIEARYVLNTYLLEKIVELKEKFNREIMLSFTKSQIFITVQNLNGIFSFPSGKLDSVEIIEELYYEIETLQSIVTDFKLNRNI